MNSLHAIREEVIAQARRAKGRRMWLWRSILLIVIHFTIVAGSALLAALVVAARIEGHWPTAFAVGLTIVAGAIVAAWPLSRRVDVIVIASCVGVGWLSASTSTGHEAATWILADSQCAAAELAVSIVPAVATILVLRHCADRPLRAFVGGLGAGATGLLVLNLTCPIDGPAHAWAFHIAPWLLVAALSALVRSRVTTVSFTA